jgi:hypothetical protein
MRHAVVDANCNVVNVVELADGAEWTPPAGCTVHASESAIFGGTFDGVAFFPPPEAAQPPRRRLVPRSLIVDRLAAAGTLAMARAALDAADLHTRERWNTRAAIYADDAAALALLQAIDADPDMILAPG